MNLYLRVLLVTIGSFFRERLKDIFTASWLRLHVLPNDLDFNGHMNNGRYLTIMDLGRFDLILRNGLFRLMLKQKSVPILGAVKIRYRLPLMPFQAYDLETKVIGWDDKWVFMEQRFIIVKGSKAGAVAAIAVLKGSFFDKRSHTTVPTDVLLKALGWAHPSPDLPAHVRKWQEAEDALRDVTRTD